MAKAGTRITIRTTTAAIAHDTPHPHGEHDHVHDHDHTRGDAGARLPQPRLGTAHTHRLDVVAGNRPSLPVLLGLGIAGGLLPDPGALAILLAAIASGR
jgi:nickel/cobalt exporter